MYESIALVELAVWLGLPAWIANATPVVFGGGRPIDGGRVLSDGHRLLGDGKTVRGFVAGVLCGTLTGLAQLLAAPYLTPLLEQFVIITPDMTNILFMTPIAAFLLSLGALVGDLTGSFLKRRIDIQSGNPSPVLDQLGFIIMALLFASPVMLAGPSYIIVLIIITLVVHWASNVMGYVLGLKKHPW
jgi:CDP-2,3-bis-(O-geranylgeranyl)-sn-glycerol synthase